MSHELNKNIRSDKRTLCDICGNTFVNNYALNRHTLNKHTDYRGFQCCVCLSWFKTRKDLTQHVRFEHLNIRLISPRLQCPETFQVWQRVHVKFISIPKLGITRHDLTIFILDTLRERRQRGLCRPEI